MTARAHPEAGFTLAETLVALFILAIVSSAGAALLIGASSTSQQIREQEEAARALDVAQSLIRQDIGAMSTRGIRPADGFSPAGNLFGEASRGDAPFLRFVRSGWLNPGLIEPRSNFQAVEYALRNGNLVRDASLRPDATNGTPVSSRVLLEGVDRVELSFVRGGQRSDFWQGDAGQSLNTLPDMIEMIIIFENETRLTIAALSGGRI
ncbi:MAG: type II secretion system minor pseudopilin GspJ [Pseudomonadota bacterium]